MPLRLTSAEYICKADSPLAPTLSAISPEYGYVLVAGFLSARKGLKYLLEAWVELDLDDALLNVCGITNPDIFPPLKNVQFGWVPDLVETYQCADVFCLPAVEDGCPLATYEAMACGTVPIVSTQTGTKQHIYHGRNGFVIPPKDRESIKQYLQMLYDDREQGKYLGKKARETAEAFPWEKHEQEYVKWIKTF